MMSPRRYTLTLLAIVAVGMAARLFHYNLATNSDEQHYIVFARQLSGPVPLPILHFFTTRILWGWTLNLWGRLCALDLEWTAVLMFLFAAASIVLVAMIAKRVFGPAAGLVAAAIQATYFINLRYDIMVTPDGLAVPMALLATMLVLDFLKIGGTARLVFAGVILGALIGIKDYYAMMSIPFSLCLLFRPQPRAAVCIANRPGGDSRDLGNCRRFACSLVELSEPWRPAAPISAVDHLPARNGFQIERDIIACRTPR